MESLRTQRGRLPNRIQETYLLVGLAGERREIAAFQEPFSGPRFAPAIPETTPTAKTPGRRPLCTTSGMKRGQSLPTSSVSSRTGQYLAHMKVRMGVGCNAPQPKGLVS